MRQRIVHAVTPRSSFAIAANYIRMQYHDAVGTTTGLAIESNVVSETQTGSAPAISNPTNADATTFAAANRGWMLPLWTANGQCSGMKITYVNLAVTSSLYRDFFRLDTMYGSSQMVLLITLKWGALATNTGSAGEYFFQMGHRGARGGYGMTLDSVASGNANFRAKMWEFSTGTLSSAVKTIAVSGSDTEYTFMCVYDGINNILSIAQDGSWAAANTTDLTAAGWTGGATDWGAPGASNDGLSVLGGINGGGTNDSGINEGGVAASQTNTIRVNNMLWTRFESDQSANFAELADQYHQNPREIPPILATMT